MCDSTTTLQLKITTREKHWNNCPDNSSVSCNRDRSYNRVGLISKNSGFKSSSWEGTNDTLAIFDVSNILFFKIFWLTLKIDYKPTLTFIVPHCCTRQDDGHNSGFVQNYISTSAGGMKFFMRDMLHLWWPHSLHI